MDNLYELLCESVSILEPPERLTVSQAAAKYRKLNNPGAYVGDWKNETVPYLIEPQDLIRSRDYQAVILVAGAQTGKTDALIINPIVHSVMCDPIDMIVYQTSMATARDFSKRRIDRMHTFSDKVGAKLRTGSRYDNTHDKHYVNGMMLSLSWPTINEMSGKPVGLVALTDLDRMPLDINGEGSPFDLARKRTTSYESAGMTVAESTPGHPVAVSNHLPKTLHEAPPAPGILALYNRGDRRRWYWPCSSCEEFYQPSFELLKWVDSDDSLECGESAKMMCPHCSALEDHSMKYELNNHAHWLKDGCSISSSGIITGEGVRSDIASFWVKGTAAAFASWKTIVTNYVNATREFERTGNQQALKTTVNTDQGEPYIPIGGGLIRLPEDLKMRAEDFGSDTPVVPEGVRFLIVTIDVQKNHWVVQVHGVLKPPADGMMFDTVVIDRYDIRKSKRYDDDGDRRWVSPGSYLEDWSLLTEQVLQSSYPLADDSGRRMGVKIMACDSGGKKGVTAMAYQYWLNLRSIGLAGRVVLVKGQPRPSAPRVEITYPDNQLKGMAPSQTGQVPVLMINSDKVKDHLNNMLDRTEPGGIIRFSDLLEDDFYTELTVETCHDGKWTNSKKLRNESWDLLHYYFAVCFHLRVEFIKWDKPPEWAETWDNNSLVFSEVNKMIPSGNKNTPSLKDLGNLLG